MQKYQRQKSSRQRYQTAYEGRNLPETQPNNIQAQRDTIHSKQTIHHPHQANPHPNSQQPQLQYSQSLQHRIKHYLKQLVFQKDYIKKLMIQTILSSLYIEQNNYQQSYKMLTDIQKTLNQVEKINTSNMNGKQQHESKMFQLEVIKIKMLTNFIVVEIINLQLESFQRHLNQALTLILSFKDKKHTKNSINKDSENINPNASHSSKSSNDKMILFFKLFLKGLSGFQSFQEIQTHSLITECNMDGQNHIEKYFQFSNISFLKLLSQDHESAYKLEACSYEIIEKDIQNFKNSNKQIQLKHVIMKTICLKKLIYLCQILQLPTQIIKKYQQQLNSSQCLKSKYLNGLQQNTIFRNYNQKFDLAFKLISKLKQFQKQFIIPVLFYQQTNKSNFSTENSVNNNGYQLWQYKALKIKLIQLLCCKKLQNNTETKQNLVLILRTLDKGIEYQKNYTGQSAAVNGKCFQIQQIILLQNLRQSTTNDKTSLKNISSLYNKAILDYQNILQLLIKSLQAILKKNIFQEVFQKIYDFSRNRKSEFQLSDHTKKQSQYEEQEQKQHNRQQNNSQEQDEPSLELEDVQVEVVKYKSPTVQYNLNTQNQKLNNQQIYNAFQQLKIKQNQSKQINNQNYAKFNHNQNIKDKRSSNSHQHKKEIKKAIFINDKTQINLNYQELGSRVKLNQAKTAENQNVKSRFLENGNNQHLNKNKKVKQKKVQFFQSIKSQQGQVSMPNQQSVVRYGHINYPYEQRHKLIQSNSSVLQNYKNALKKYEQSPKHINKYQNQDDKLISKHYINNISQGNVKQYKIHNQINQVSNSQISAVSRSRQKKSSLSPKGPKHTTINSRLNQHVLHHELNYSPSSLTSKLKRNNQFQQNNSQFQYKRSQNLSDVNEKSKSKTKPKSKVQKSAYLSTNQNRKSISAQKKSYSKSKIQTSNNNLQTKTIKYKDFKQTLQKSGIKLKEQENSNKISSKAKLEGNYKPQNRNQPNQLNHRRNLTEYYEDKEQIESAHALNQNKKRQGNTNILDYFMTEMPKQINNSRFGRIQNQSQSDKNNKAKIKDSKINKNKKIRPTISDDQFNQSPEQSVYQQNQIKNQSITKKIVTQSENNIPINKQPSNIKPPLSVGAKQNSQAGSRINKTKQNTQNIFPMSLSPNMVTDYVLKLMKSHQQKLKQKIRLCKNGQYIDKKHYTSDGGQQRFLQLSSDNKYLQWAVNQQKLISGNKKKYQIANIRGVVYGKVTQTMRKQFNKVLEPYKCVSFIFQKRTFDMYCPDDQDVKFWLPGISYSISQLRPQLNHANYTINIQKYVRKRQQVIKKDQFHRLQGYYSLGRVLWKKALLKMQHLYLNKNKKAKRYNNSNAGAIIQFRNAMINAQKNQIQKKSMLPPTGKQSKVSKQKSASQVSKSRN